MDELDRIVRNKVNKAMEEIVYPKPLIDADEWKTIDSYVWREHHILNNSGILNYDDNSNPLSPAYFEREKQPTGPGSHHSVQPQYSRH